MKFLILIPIFLLIIIQFNFKVYGFLTQSQNKEFSPEKTIKSNLDEFDSLETVYITTENVLLSNINYESETKIPILTIEEKLNKLKIPWISPSKLWNQLGFPIAPNLQELLLVADHPIPPPPNNIDISTYNLNNLNGIIYGSLICECGLPRGRIVGEGKVKARINDIPWTAAIVEKDGWTQPFCGATLINDRYVITAAHCVKSRKPQELVIWLNDEDLLLSNETVRLVYEVIEIIKHPESRGYINDIALIKLNDTVPLEKHEFNHVNPVCIPIDNTIDYSQKNGTVAGWGRTTSGGDVSPVLLKIDVPILENKLCIEKSKYKDAIRDTMMCAGILESGGADACQGDSGGPLIVKNMKEDPAILVGIVSWGFGCAEPFSPGVYTRVSYYLEWILESTKDANWCQPKI